MRKLILSVVMLLCTGSLFAETTIYVHTGSGMYSDPDKGRRDSAKEVSDELAKRPGIKLVDAEEKAQVVVQILGREDKLLKARMTAGDFTSMIETSHDNMKVRFGPRKVWKEAAENMADEITSWIKANEARLP